MGLCGHYSSLCQHTIHEDVYRCFDIIDTSQWVPNGYYVGQVFKTAQDFIFVLLTRELLAIQFNQQIHFLCRGKDVTLTFFFLRRSFFGLLFMHVWIMLVHEKRVCFSWRHQISKITKNTVVSAYKSGSIQKQLNKFPFILKICTLLSSIRCLWVYKLHCTFHSSIAPAFFFIW